MKKPQWRTFSTKINQAAASVYVDIAAKVITPFERRPCLLWIWVSLQAARSDGLSTETEAPTLVLVEHALISAFGLPLQAQFVGRVTTQGRMEFYFYAPSKIGFPEAVGNAMARYPTYLYNWGEQDDPEWSHFEDVLYPSQVQMDEIENARLIDMLRKNGDRLTIARPIEHYAFFTDLAQAEVFAGEVERKGYTVTNRSRMPGNVPKHGITFQREEVPALASITKAMQELRRLATDRGGEYDGWETDIVLT